MNGGVLRRAAARTADGIGPACGWSATCRSVRSSAAASIRARSSPRWRGSAPGQLKTFSIGFREADYNELEYARSVARQFGTEHHELVLEPDVLDILDDLAWYLDEPFGDSSAIPTYMVSKMASEHVTVLLSGDGGDEVFAGYDKYVPARPAHREPGLPSRPDPFPRAGCAHSRRRARAQFRAPLALAGPEALPGQLHAVPRRTSRHVSFNRKSTLLGGVRPLGGGTEHLRTFRARPWLSALQSARPAQLPAAGHPGQGRSDEHGAIRSRPAPRCSITSSSSSPRRSRPGSSCGTDRPSTS